MATYFAVAIKSHGVVLMLTKFRDDAETYLNEHDPDNGRFTLAEVEFDNPLYLESHHSITCGTTFINHSRK